MKRKRLLIITISFLVAVTLGALLWPREREPEYNGIPLRTWAIRCGNPHDAVTRDAIRQIGTNSLPLLVRWIQHDTPRWKTWLLENGDKLPGTFVNSRFAGWLVTDNSAIRANATIVAFAFLGPDADPALPELQRIATRSKSSQKAKRAQISIAFIKGRFVPGDFEPDLMP